MLAPLLPNPGWSFLLPISTTAPIPTSCALSSYTLPGLSKSCSAAVIIVFFFLSHPQNTRQTCESLPWRGVGCRAAWPGSLLTGYTAVRGQGGKGEVRERALKGKRDRGKPGWAWDIYKEKELSCGEKGWRVPDSTSLLEELR